MWLNTSVDMFITSLLEIYKTPVSQIQMWCGSNHVHTVDTHFTLNSIVIHFSSPVKKFLPLFLYFKTLTYEPLNICGNTAVLMHSCFTALILPLRLVFKSDSWERPPNTSLLKRFQIPQSVLDNPLTTPGLLWSGRLVTSDLVTTR